MSCISSQISALVISLGLVIVSFSVVRVVIPESIATHVPAFHPRNPALSLRRETDYAPNCETEYAPGEKHNDLACLVAHNVAHKCEAQYALLGVRLPEINGLRLARGMHLIGDMDATTTTLDLGNNEQISRGVFANGDGTYMAMTFSQSKTFKTRKGAEKWLARVTS